MHQIGYLIALALYGQTHAFAFCIKCIECIWINLHIHGDRASSTAFQPFVFPVVRWSRGVQVAELQSRMQAAASRGAEEVDEIRRSCEERMSAMRSELEQQEVDKAALLDIVQVHLCALPSTYVSHRLEQAECPHAVIQEWAHRYVYLLYTSIMFIYHV